jgi:hypothetical protein
MACPQVVDGGDGLQIWKVAVNILNKQSWRADKGWSPSLVPWQWLTTHKHKKPTYYRMLLRTSDLGRFFGMT